jgi:hypothetical protein
MGAERQKVGGLRGDALLSLYVYLCALANCTSRRRQVAIASQRLAPLIRVSAKVNSTPRNATTLRLGRIASRRERWMDGWRDAPLNVTLLLLLLVLVTKTVG